MTRFAAFLLAGAVATAACGSAEGTANRQPLVIVTTTILGDITANVVGDLATVEVIMPVGADPHAYEASARQAARLREADLIVANGIRLEEGLLDVIAEAEAEGVAVLRIGDSLDPRPFGAAGVHGDDEHAGDVAEHDAEGGLDPHVWMDPIRMVEAAGLIGRTLRPLLGEGVTRGAAAYQDRLRELSERIETAIATIPAERRVLVTNHFAYGYYAERYGLEMLGTVIPAATTEAETSAAQFAELVALIERERVPAIFGSTTEPATLAEAIAADVGFPVEVVTLHTGSLGGPGSGATTYIDMMHTSTARIVEVLTAEEPP
jgi:zinc/manganese transport system substrate-binding protein